MNTYKYIFFILLIFLPQTSQAGWSDFVSDIKKTVKQKAGVSTTSTLSEDKIIAGLKQALNQGVEKSVKQLGTRNGFLKDASVKIPMPHTLKNLDRGLRIIGQNKLADKFINTMNHAAEKAVPETLDILVSAVKSMTLKDAVKILNGEDDAATQYFKRNSMSELRIVIKPIVHKATNKVGLTNAYKKMINKAGYLARYIDKDSLDIDQYVTNKTIDGLFMKIAVEEKRIRKDPVARTTDLLKDVFGG
ncbi:MAG: DUF4197 domain-containing protein [Gammaproteobacteria bacterium]